MKPLWVSLAFAVAVGCAGAGLGCKSWTDAIDTKMIAKNEFAQRASTGDPPPGRGTVPDGSVTPACAIWSLRRLVTSTRMARQR